MTKQALRKDAVLNRERLIAAGRELFAQRGLDVSLNDVAHHAGVGVGTAYRRFANKEELIQAIWDQQVDELEAICHEALSVEKPWDGLVLYLERSLAAQAKDRGMVQILSGHTWPDQYDKQRDRLAPLVNQIVDRVVDTGDLRKDVTGTDLIFLQIAFASVAGVVQDGTIPHGRQDATELHRRYLWIALDGLRASPQHSVLPLPPLTTAQTHTLLQPRARK